jgi:hypothetical protein
VKHICSISGLAQVYQLEYVIFMEFLCEIDRVPSPTGDLSQGIRVRRRRRRWTTAALVRRDHRKKRGDAGGGEQGGGATVLTVTLARGEELRGL